MKLRGTCKTYARVLEANVRTGTNGKRFLSLAAEPLEADEKEQTPRLRIMSFHKTHIDAGLLPGHQICVEGRFEWDKEMPIPMRIMADQITLTLDVLIVAKNAPPASKQADGRASTGGIPSNSQVGSATFAPKNPPKLSEVELFKAQFPAEVTGAKSKYGRGVDWEKGDSLEGVL